MATITIKGLSNAQARLAFEELTESTLLFADRFEEEGHPRINGYQDSIKTDEEGDDHYEITYIEEDVFEDLVEEEEEDLDDDGVEDNS